jgi:hypothetical protein
MEEAQVAHLFQASKEFYGFNKKSDRGPERVKKYEELTEKNLWFLSRSSYRKREDSFDHYQTEISLREKELAGLKSQKRREKKMTASTDKVFR